MAKRIAARIPQATHGQWFRFCDANGRGYCQVDILFHDPGLDSWIVIECKLTDTEQAQAQLRDLYLPVVSMALGQAQGIVVTKYLTPASKVNAVYGSLGAARAAVGHCPVWHWIGRGPI